MSSILAQIRANQKFLKLGKRLEAKTFQPLAIELGWIVYEWNRLHESLGEIFANVVSEGRNEGPGLPRHAAPPIPIAAYDRRPLWPRPLRHRAH